MIVRLFLISNLVNFCVKWLDVMIFCIFRLVLIV